VAKVLPSFKEAHPSWSIRNRAPTVPVTIDWKNPLSRGLCYFVFPNCGVPIEAVSGVVGNNEGALIAPRREGACFDANNGDVYVDFDVPTLSVGGGPFTIAMSSAWSTTTNALYHFGICNTGDFRNFFYMNQATSGRQRFFSRDSNNTTQISQNTSSGWNDESFHMFACTGIYAASESREFYIDGTQRVTNTFGTAGTFVLDVNNVTVGCFQRDTISSYANNQLQYGAFWVDKKSQGDLWSFYENPYQVLKPRVAPVYFLPSAGASTILATGDATLPAFNADATGVIIPTNEVIGDATLPAFTADGTGIVFSTITGTGDATLPAFTAGGVGTVFSTILATGDAALPAFNADATGIVFSTILATGDATLPAFTASGTAATPVVIAATAAATLSSFTASGTAALPSGLDMTANVVLETFEATGYAQVQRHSPTANRIPYVTPTRRGPPPIDRSGFFEDDSLTDLD
jgi:hypothetical protein